MNDWTRRLALAGLLGFFIFVLALPVSCCGFVFYNEHLYGDVQTGGPEAILKAMGVSLLLGLVAGALVWRRARPR